MRIAAATTSWVLSLSMLWSTGAMATMLSLVPHDQLVALGEQVEVDVRIAELTDGLGAYSFSVEFDPAVLRFAGTVDAGGLGQIGLETLGLSWQSFGGSVSFFDLSFLDPVSLLDLQSDSFSLFSLAFDTVSLGTSQLSFDSVDLADADAMPILAERVSGSVTVTPAVSVPEPSGVGLMLGALALLALSRKRRLEVVPEALRPGRGPEGVRC